MVGSRRCRRAVIGALAGASLVLSLAACGGSAESAVQAGPTGSAPPGTRTTGGTGTTLATSDGTAPPGTAPGAETTLPVADGSTTTTALGGAAIPGAPTTAAPGGPVTTLAPGVTRAPGGGGGVNPPPPTAAPTVAPTTAPPTTAAPKPTLTLQIATKDLHCMSGAGSVSATVKWTTTGATSVAVALGSVPDAFLQPLNGELKQPNSQLPVFYPCSGAPGDTRNEYATVSAEGPGGRVHQSITWTIHNM